MTGTVTAVTAKKDQVSDGKPVDRSASASQIGNLTERGTPTDLCFVPCGSRISHPWLCVETKPSAEIEADWNLRDQGFASWLPLYETERNTIAPLFPRYLFVQLTDRAPSWSPVRGSRGVASIITRSRAGDAALVSSDQLIPLWRRCEPNGVIYRPRLRPGAAGIRTGATVTLNIGGRDITGICQMSASDRVVVLMCILGAERQVVAASGRVNGST